LFGLAGGGAVSNNNMLRVGKIYVLAMFL